jgi:dynein heavy chain 1
VGIHNTVIELNKKLSKPAKKFNYITPRDFLDLIKNFVELYNEKKSMLEDQHYHLNVGLDKFKQTKTEVLEMQGSLDLKKAELEKKDKEASEKMTLIVHEDTKAKEKQEESSKLKVVLEAKSIQISAKSEVEADLAKAEPALISAKKNMENINSNDLNTINSYTNPLANVELALYCDYIIANNLFS